MIYAQLGNLRLSTIHTLNPTKKSTDKDFISPTDMLENGLHLETRGENYQGKETWYAIAKITYNVDELTYEIQSVGTRLMDTLTPDNLEDAQFLCKYANKIMYKLWAKDHVVL